MHVAAATATCRCLTSTAAMSWERPKSEEEEISCFGWGAGVVLVMLGGSTILGGAAGAGVVLHHALHCPTKAHAGTPAGKQRTVHTYRADVQVLTLDGVNGSHGECLWWEGRRVCAAGRGVSELNPGC